MEADADTLGGRGYGTLGGRGYVTMDARPSGRHPLSAQQVAAHGLPYGLLYLDRWPGPLAVVS